MKQFTNPWDLVGRGRDAAPGRGGDRHWTRTTYLRLWFAGWRGGDVGVKEVHLFLNDADHGGSEEAHLFRVMEASAY
eukprot:gene4870-3489_t